MHTVMADWSCSTGVQKLSSGVLGWTARYLQPAPANSTTATAASASHALRLDFARLCASAKPYRSSSLKTGSAASSAKAESEVWPG